MCCFRGGGSPGLSLRWSTGFAFSVCQGCSDSGTDFQAVSLGSSSKEVEHLLQLRGNCLALWGTGGQCCTELCWHGAAVQVVPESVAESMCLLSRQQEDVMRRFYLHLQQDEPLDCEICTWPLAQVANCKQYEAFVLRLLMS